MIGTGSPSYFCRVHPVSTGWNAGVRFQPQPALALGVAAIGFASSLTMLAAGIPTTTWERWCLGHYSCMGNITAFRVPIWPSEHLDHNHEWTSIWTHHVNINCVVCEYRCFHSLTRTKGGSAASRHVSNELLMNFLGAQIKPAEHLSVALTGPGCQFSCRNASRPLYAGAGAGARAGPPGPLGREDHRNHRIIQPSLVQAQSDPVPGFENRSEALQYMGFNIV